MAVWLDHLKRGGKSRRKPVFSFLGGNFANASLCRWVQPLLRLSQGYASQVARSAVSLRAHPSHSHGHHRPAGHADERTRSTKARILQGIRAFFFAPRWQDRPAPASRCAISGRVQSLCGLLQIRPRGDPPCCASNRRTPSACLAIIFTRLGHSPSRGVAFFIRGHS